MNQPTQAIILGGGASVSEGLSLGLKEKLQGRFTVGCNFSFYTFDNTFNTFCDSDFYRGQLLKPPEPINTEHINKLKSLPLMVGLMKNEINTMNYGNTIFLKDASVYLREKMIKKGVYFNNLTGVFTLALMSWLMNFSGEIYLLGYDWSRGTQEEQKSKPLEPYRNVKTHFYDIKHRGQGLVRFYERHNPDYYFAPFVAEKDLKIFNVSPHSNIDCFEKINYEHMFSLLNTQTYNQDELRTQIKERLLNEIKNSA